MPSSTLLCRSASPTSAGTIQFVNAAFEQLTGYAREEIIGHTVLLLRSNDEKPAVYEEMWNAILTGQPFLGIVKNRKKNGDSFLSDKTIMPLPQSDGRVGNFIFYDRDLSAQNSPEGQPWHAQKLHEVHTTGGEISHGLNNLLMIISAHAELVLNSLEEESCQRKSLQQIVIATRRGSQLATQPAELTNYAPVAESAPGGRKASRRASAAG